MTLECQERLKVCILLDSSMNGNSWLGLEVILSLFVEHWNIVLTVVLLEMHSICDSLYCIYTVFTLL